MNCELIYTYNKTNAFIYTACTVYTVPTSKRKGVKNVIIRKNRKIEVQIRFTSLFG